MFDNIIAYSVENKFVVGLFVAALMVWGFFSLKQLPIDAVPDITNNQVQIITISPTLATQEVEQFITTPVELAVQSLQRTEEIRSISRFGLSVITVVFEEDYDIYLARQLVSEKLKQAQENIPEGFDLNFSSSQLTGNAKTTINIVVDSDVTGGKYPVTIKGLNNNNPYFLELVINVFTDKFDPITLEEPLNNSEIKTLTNLRDTILPKLISGELSITDTEKLIDEATA